MVRRGRRKSAEDRSSLAPHQSNADDERQVAVADSNGRETLISLSDYRFRYLPDQIEIHWHNYEQLAQLCSQCLEHDLIEESLKISEHLLLIDRNLERSTSFRAKSLLKTGRIEESYEICTSFLTSHGDGALVLAIFAEVLEESGKHEQVLDVLWRAVQSNPNSADILHRWVGELASDGNPETFASALHQAAGLSHAWLPLLELARHNDEARYPSATEIYGEILNRGGHDTYVLLSVIADLGKAGRFSDIVDLIQPWFNTGRHDPMVGVGLLQACIDARRLTDADTVMLRLASIHDPNIRTEVAQLADRLTHVRLEEKAALAATNEDFGITDDIVTNPGTVAISARFSRANAQDSNISALTETAGWYSALREPAFIFPTRTASPMPLTALPLFCDRLNDPVIAGLSVGIPKYLSDMLCLTTSLHCHVEMPHDSKGHARLATGAFHSEEARKMLAHRVPLRGPVLCGEIGGTSEARRIEIILADRDSFTPVWSYKVVGPDVALSRGIDELLLAVEEQVVERRLGAPITKPNWLAPVPSYLGVAYVHAEAASVQLSGVANGLLSPYVAQRADDLLRPIIKLCQAHSASGLPKLIAAGALVSACEAIGIEGLEAVQSFEPIIESDNLHNSPLWQIRPILSELAGMNYPTDAAGREQLMAENQQYASWMGSIKELAHLST